jgi:ATP-GRASP peptide maturase of grasp-with-spasm system
MQSNRKQILILSEPNDKSTWKVLAYLSRQGTNVIKVYYRTDYLPNLRLTNDNLNSKFFGTTKIKSFWYRRGDFAYNLNLEQKSFSELGNYLSKEWKILRSTLHYVLNQQAKTLGSAQKEFSNNLLQDLFVAQSVNLDIPKFLVTTEKKEIIDFIVYIKKVICKPLKSYPNFAIEGTFFSSDGAFLVNEAHLDNLDNQFFPTLFQEYIEKEFEIRIFYLKGKCYSMAIFSQLDEKTKIDYRNYNRIKPNRNVPFKLPIDIENKICSFMKKAQLDTGSIDMIKSTDGRYVFLEVNPAGQFDWLSVNCNYYIEKKIAHFLIYGNTKFN